MYFISWNPSFSHLLHSIPVLIPDSDNPFPVTGTGIQICIPKFWEREREWKNHSQNSGTGMGGRYSREWPGTGIPAHPWLCEHIFASDDKQKIYWKHTEYTYVYTFMYKQMSHNRTCQASWKEFFGDRVISGRGLDWSANSPDLTLFSGYMAKRREGCLILVVTLLWLFCHSYLLSTPPGAFSLTAAVTA